ncbi:glutamine-hydrolyzing carbamoyl-phosphate synthase small subunit [soil metagenome]
MKGKLILKDGTTMEGSSFGGTIGKAGEVVFATGMMGYPESLTDPSYEGQILVLTYPLIGNYGVPDSTLWESQHIMVSGLIVSQYIDTPSHFQSTQTLGAWFEKEGVPLLEIKDTRFLAQKIRDKGVQLGKIEFEKKVAWYDPNKENLVAQVSTKEIIVQEPSYVSTALSKKLKTIVLIDCGAKRNIQRALLERGVRVVTVPWDMDIFASDFPHKFDGLMISNGPGDPQTVTKTVETVKKALQKNVVTFGICLGHQILALAAGGDTKKLPYGHRSQNQPCIMQGTKTCMITTQNHGFAVSKIPDDFKVWFTNANDGSNEGIIHKSGRFRSVQFHPEATPGPMDAEWLFDSFLEEVRREEHHNGKR